MNKLSDTVTPRTLMKLTRLISGNVVGCWMLGATLPPPVNENNFL